MNSHWEHQTARSYVAEIPTVALYGPSPLPVKNGKVIKEVVMTYRAGIVNLYRSLETLRDSRDNREEAVSIWTVRVCCTTPRVPDCARMDLSDIRFGTYPKRKASIFSQTLLRSWGRMARD